MNSLNTNELVCISISESKEHFQAACEQFGIHPIAFPVTISDSVSKNYALFQMNGNVADRRMIKVITGCLHTLFGGNYKRKKLQQLIVETPIEELLIPKEIMNSNVDPAKKIDVVYLIETACFKVNYEAPSKNGSKSVKDFLHDIGLRSEKSNAALEVVRRPMKPETEITKSCDSLLYILDTGHNFVKIHFAVNSQMVQHVNEEQLSDIDTVKSGKGKNIPWDETDRIDSLTSNEATKCQLLQHLKQGQKVDLNALNGLCQSLCNVKAAQTTLKHWMQHSHMYSEVQTDIIQHLLSRFRRIGYPSSAIQCKSFCSHYEDCKQRQVIVFHRVSDLLKQRQNYIATLRSDRRPRKPPEMIQSDMRKQFDQDLSSDESKVYVYKSFVGIGKTQMYLERIDGFIQDGMTVIIAFPSHQLKKDVLCRLSKHLSAEVIIEKVLDVPDLPKINEAFEEEVKSYYQIGDNSGARKYIKEYRKENIVSKDPTELTLDEHRLEQYLRVTASLHDQDQTTGKIIMTTHERLFSLAHIQPDIVIIDEDITSALLKQDSVEKDELYALKLLERNLQGASNRKVNYQTVITRLNEIIHAVPNKMYSLTKLYDASVKASVLQTISQQRKVLFKSRIIDLLFNATDFVTHVKINEDDEDKSKVSFIIRRELPFQCKTFIMSATADKEIYDRLFQTQNMSFVEFDLPILAAAITMRHDYSFSRSWFTDNLNGLDSFLQYSQLLRDYRMDKNRRGLVPRQAPNQPLIITFKSYEDEFKWRGYDLTLHYGNVTGIDEYGRSSIVVFGTPNVHSAVYALFVNALFPEHRMENIPVYVKQLVSNGKYRFHFRTDKDHRKFRKIHIWMVESELVQAVGRARPITNPAPIRIYSNYPPGDLDITFLNNTSPHINSNMKAES